jgi:hypothetical protein
MGRKPRFRPKSPSTLRLPLCKAWQSALVVAKALSQHASTFPAGNGRGRDLLKAPHPRPERSLTLRAHATAPRSAPRPNMMMPMVTKIEDNHGVRGVTRRRQDLHPTLRETPRRCTQRQPSVVIFPRLRPTRPPTLRAHAAGSRPAPCRHLRPRRTPAVPPHPRTTIFHSSLLPSNF